MLVAAQLAHARRAAENWRNGLVALIGLIAAFSVIKGPDNVSGLAPWAALLVGVLLLLALASATFGAWMSLAAAYGTPSVITRERARALGGIDGFKLHLATQSVVKLRLAQGATIATLLLVASAVGLTWYGPRPVQVILTLERKSLPSVCGQLVNSRDGYLELQPSTSGLVRVYTADLLSARAVKACP